MIDVDNEALAGLFEAMAKDARKGLVDYIDVQFEQLGADEVTYLKVEAQLPLKNFDGGDMEHALRVMGGE